MPDERQEELARLFLKHSRFNIKSSKWDHNYSLNYNGKDYPVCELVFAHLKGFTKHAFDSEACRQKKILARDHNFIITETPYNDSTLHPFNNLEMVELFSENVVNVPDVLVPDFARHAMTPLPDRQTICINWLDNYFKTFTDHSPNSLFSKVSLTYKKDLYDLYVHQVNKHSKIVTYARFLELWNVLFPYCINRPWCNVPGKCETCFMIQEARNTMRQDYQTAKMLQQIHAIHRGGLFMLERAEYKKRVLSVTSEIGKKTKMSIIIDGMDQSHCQVPYYGPTHTFADPIIQHITGVKEHGHCVTIYRTLGTVSKGANLTLYCILSQIESWKSRHNGKYPEELFLQLDGGSENANKYVLGMLEFLVYKRLIKRITYTRLPTGHTHEDIGNINFELLS